MIFLQHYWWALVSLLGALLVFLMYIQGGQTLFLGTAKSKEERTLLATALGHKWELTFTTLVTFGGAIFASFPLYYSTSFGGAYWLWMIILLLFVVQAVSYEYRNKAGNLLGAKTYETFLFLNGLLGTILLGVAVGTFFSGGAFIMDKTALTNIGAPVISKWANSAHGLDAIFVPFNLLLGIVVYFAARTLGLLYVNTQIESPALVERCRKQLFFTAPVFVLLFVVFLVYLFLSTGYGVDRASGIVSPVKYKYFFNMIELIWPLVMLLVGVVLVLFGLARQFMKRYKFNFYIVGIGVVLAVWSLLICAAFNNTAYFVSTVDPQYSLTLYNSSSSEFTLTAMAYVSILIPFVLLYIIKVWRAMSKTKVSTEDLNLPDSNQY